MQADFSVELGGGAPALEVPWCSDDPSVRYYDLKIHPELVLQIPEARAYPELASFLSRINTAEFPLATAKCDVWTSDKVAPEEEIFGDRKFVSYVDLIFVNESDRYSFEKHETFVKDLCRLLGNAPEIAATVELVVRHCYYHKQDSVSENNAEPERPPVSPMVREPSPTSPGNTDVSIMGFCITAYVTGFGDSDYDPVRRWTIALNLLQHAIVQLNSNTQPSR